ncbi:MAG: MMPL family transporter [Clostridiales bacterium]|jgi:predicted RND superfamily exporter protein|nr:MMPL family transporter [Clostridiales bacterium]
MRKKGENGIFNKVPAFIIKNRFLVIGFFVLLTAFSLWAMNRVNINYNLAKYLPSDSETNLTLKLMEEEFGQSGQAEIMIKSVTIDEALALKRRVDALNHTVTVTFFNDPAYFKDTDGDGVGDALFKIVIDGDDYSENAEQLIADLKSEFKSYDIALNGQAVNNLDLKNRISDEMTIMFILAIIIVAAVLIFTSKSLMEPIIIGIVIGVSVLINLGTNVFLGEISYIVKSIAAILQMALAMDYSIVTMHHYNEIKLHEPNEKTAMAKALKKSFSIVSASSLTTIASLAAIIFMTFKIGADIGVVMIKALTISVLTVFLLMPGLIVVFSKPIEKLKYSPLKLFKSSKAKNANKASKGGYVKFLNRTKKILPIVMLLVTAACFVLQSQMKYEYLEENKYRIPNDIVKTFGASVQVYMTVPRAMSQEDYDKQTRLTEMLLEYYNASGERTVKDVLSYQGTVAREMTPTEAARLLNIEEGLMKQLFGTYYLENGMVGDDSIGMKSFLDFTVELIEGKRQISASADISSAIAGSADYIRLLSFLLNSASTKMTAAELTALLANVKEYGIDIDPYAFKDYISQLYGMKYYDENPSLFGKLTLKEFLNYTESLLTGKIQSGIDLSILDQDTRDIVIALNALVNNTDTKFNAAGLFEILSIVGAPLGFDVSGYREYIAVLYGNYAFDKDYSSYEISFDKFLLYVFKLLDGEGSIGLGDIIGDTEKESLSLLKYFMTEALPSDKDAEGFFNLLNSQNVKDIVGGISLTRTHVNIIYALYAEKYNGYDETTQLGKYADFDIEKRVEGLYISTVDFTVFLMEKAPILLGANGTITSILNTLASALKLLGSSTYYTYKDMRSFLNGNTFGLLDLLGIDEPTTLLLYRLYNFEKNPATNYNPSTGKKEPITQHNLMAASANTADVLEFTANLLNNDPSKADYYDADIYNSAVAAHTDASYVDTLVNICDAYKSFINGTDCTYMDTAGILGKISGKFGLDAELIKQAYILYFIGETPDAAFLSEEVMSLSEFGAYIKGMTDETSASYNKLISSVLGSDAAVINGAFELLKSITAQKDVSMSVSELAEFVDALTTAAGMSGIELSEDEIKAVYIMYLIYNELAPITVASGAQEYTMSEMLLYMETMLNDSPSNPLYNAFIAGIAANALAGISDAGQAPNLYALLLAVNDFYAVYAGEETYDYERLFSIIDGCLSVVSGELSFLLGDAGLAFDASLVEQVYVKYFTDFGRFENTPVKASVIVDFTLSMLNRPLISGFVSDGQTEMLREYKEQLAIAETMFNGTNYSRLIFVLNVKDGSEEGFAFVDTIKAAAAAVYGEGEVHLASNLVGLKEISTAFVSDIILTTIISILFILLVVMIAYRSALIPFILMIVIQGSVWISFSFNTVTNSPMFFMAYIIASCIQMGATIDYGIILSSAYTDQRKTKPKLEALSAALKSAIGPIMTSGLVLIIAGITIGSVSTSVAVSSIGHLLWRGTLTSLTMVLVVLPQILLLTDKYIERTTLKAKFFKN